MGRIAECSSDICSGTLSPLLDAAKTKKQGKPVTNGYYCESCGTLYEDIEVTNGVPRGVRPKGKMDERGTIAAVEAKYQGQIKDYEDKLISITEALVGEESDLAIKIAGILAEKPQEEAAPVPKPKLDSEAE